MAGANNTWRVDDIFTEHKARRAAIVKALTTDVDEFFRACDPDKDNLCLYGHPNGEWQVAPPIEEVPTQLPEPTLGINFPRDEMAKTDWLLLVAMRSDAWLLSVSYYYAAMLGLGRVGRQRLFDMINELPAIHEVLYGRNNTSTSHSYTSPKSNPKMPQSAEAQAAKNSRRTQPDEEDELDNEEGEHEDTQCGSCERSYAADEFWICRDISEVWFRGKCVKITPARAEHIEQYKCPLCSNNKRGRPSLCERLWILVSYFFPFLTMFTHPEHARATV